MEPTYEGQQLMAETLRRNGSPLACRERTVAVVLGIGYLLAAGAVWRFVPPHVHSAAAIAVCAAVLLLSTQVEIELPFGWTAPTQLAFVPLLVACPPALLAPVVLAVFMAARLPSVLSGRSPAVRLLQTPANCWFAVGPAVVLGAAGIGHHPLDAAVVVLALAAQFAVDFTVSALRFAVARGASLASQLGDSWVYLVDAGLSGPGWVIGAAQLHRPLVGLSVVPVLAVLHVLARERGKRLQATIKLSDAYRGTALVLGDVVEADDGYTGTHSRSVVSLAEAVGRRLGLAPERMRNLEFGALLHDVGKIAVPKDIINKPGSLTAEEWTVIKTHTTEGQRMLDRVGGFMRDVGCIVRSHHERWDGGGYPDGLSGDAIPLEARIIACCDAWNAMRTDRSYRQALSHEAAVAELTANAGSQFDPAIVRAVLEVVADDRPAAIRTQAGAPVAVVPAVGLSMG